ncbi:hypothetical protein Pelo_19756 [Pelomyxa schiedti]|nr:hypothetical protein Pelo_19756 [Pelomyxa schiedti]
MIPKLTCGTLVFWCINLCTTRPTPWLKCKSRQVITLPENSIPTSAPLFCTRNAKPSEWSHNVWELLRR